MKATVPFLYFLDNRHLLSFNMTSSSRNIEDIAQQAERDVNTHRAKAGHADGLDDAGVDSSAEKFPGSQVRYGDDLSSSHRIAPEEGGELDARGR